MPKQPSAQLDNLQTEEEKSIRRSRIIGVILLIVSICPLSITLLGKPEWSDYYYLPYLSALLILVGILFILPVNYYLFDVQDWEENDDIRMVIKKLRLRAIVFNNLSILILFIAVLVIVFSFYRIAHPNIQTLNDKLPETTNGYILLASQVGSVVVLIFLVQILFRVFKYLIRVGGFYNGKADALELNLLDTGKKYNIENLLESLTPQSYDISDVDSPGLYPGK